jgi:hypothetical protein
MQKQRITQLLKIITPCDSCGVSSKGCGVRHTDLKEHCPCAICLVRVMCKQICTERFTLTERDPTFIGAM